MNTINLVIFFMTLRLWIQIKKEGMFPNITFEAFMHSTWNVNRNIINCKSWDY
jgi:hypothetical protein